MCFFFFLDEIDRIIFFFFFSSRRRHTRSTRDWSSDVCSSDLIPVDELESFLIRSQGLTDSDAKLLARLARGSLGRALSADLETYRERRAAMLTVLKALTLEGDVGQLLRAAEELAAGDRDEYEQTLEGLETLIRDAWSLRLERPQDPIINLDLVTDLKPIAAE